MTDLTRQQEINRADKLGEIRRALDQIHLRLVFADAFPEAAGVAQVIEQVTQREAALLAREA